ALPGSPLVEVDQVQNHSRLLPEEVAVDHAGSVYLKVDRSLSCPAHDVREESPVVWMVESGVLPVDVGREVADAAFAGDGAGHEAREVTARSAHPRLLGWIDREGWDPGGRDFGLCGWPDNLKAATEADHAGVVEACDELVVGLWPET